jgi:hypothetical protein
MGPQGLQGPEGPEGPPGADATLDTTAPVPGNSGTLNALVSGGDITISWTAATDNSTSQANLEYTLLYSTADNISTVADAEANGTPFALPWASNIVSRTISTLTVGTTYYFNVLVKDAGLNKSIYSAVTASPSPSYLVLYDSGQDGTGNLGGRSGANALCTANRPAGFSNSVAFLSVSATDTIAGRQAFPGLNTSSEIRSPNGTVIANNWSDLLDGSIDVTLQFAGIPLSTGFWWSGANADGTLGLTCSGWTSAVDAPSGGSPAGDWGVSGQANSLWINPGNVDRTFCLDPSDVLCIAW